MDVLYILWKRQMLRYFRSRSRVIGAIGQPLLFLLALGYGLGSVYKQAGQGDYLQFLVPGIIVQTLLFSGVFWGIQILFDKRFGFLKEMLVAPVSRLRILMGNALGGVTINVIQATLVLIIAIVLGFRPESWAMLPVAYLVMIGLSVMLTSFGAAIASMVEDFQGFQAINNFLVFPLFFLSSALYPLANAPVLESSLVHRVYNRLALIAVVVVIVGTFTHVVIGGLTIIGALAMYGVTTVIYGGLRTRRINRKEKLRLRESPRREQTVEV